MQASKGNVSISDISGIVPLLDMIRIQAVVLDNHALTCVRVCAELLIEGMEASDPVAIMAGYHALKGALALVEDT